VERVTKQEYGAYVRQHVFQPLGMSSAQICDARTVVPHLASGYEADGGALVNAAFISWKLPFAAGAVCASATDLLKWQAALDAGRVLSPSSLALMRTPTTLADGTIIDYGLGTRLGSLEGHRVLGHTGSGAGFSAVLESFPDDQVAIVVLMNMGIGSGPPIVMATEIARAALGLPEKNALRDLPLPKEEVVALTGAKFDSDEGVVENFDRDGKLYFRVPGGQAEGVLLRQAQYVYAINEYSEVHFVANSASSWGMVYVGGLFVDAKYRVH
jgi:D-alanyl-D-alanine carboxypeptidase